MFQHILNFEYPGHMTIIKNTIYQNGGGTETFRMKKRTTFLYTLDHSAKLIVIWNHVQLLS